VTLFSQICKVFFAVFAEQGAFTRLGLQSEVGLSRERVRYGIESTFSGLRTSERHPLIFAAPGNKVDPGRMPWQPKPWPARPLVSRLVDRHSLDSRSAGPDLPFYQGQRNSIAATPVCSQIVGLLASRGCDPLLCHRRCSIISGPIADQ
jgi:hypothetical protein